MGWFISFIVCWMVVETIIMVLSMYDDYGENWILSLIFTVVIVGAVAVVSSEDGDTDQEAMLESQWSETVIEDALSIEAIEQKEVDDYYNDVEQPQQLQQPFEEDTNEAIIQQKRTVPANRAYIESNRRNYEMIVIYDHETREACDDVECFSVQLIQHTDGTYWACKRNYGVCYGY